MPILLTPCGISITARAVQLLNAEALIAVISFVNSIWVRLVQATNALAGIMVILPLNLSAPLPVAGSKTFSTKFAPKPSVVSGSSGFPSLVV